MTAPKVYAAIQAVMKAVGVIGKGRTNKFQGYQFRGIDDVMAALQGHLIEHHLVILPRVLSYSREFVETKKEGRMAMAVVHAEYDFISTEDGSRHTVSFLGEGGDTSDKSVNKAMAGAYKYMATQTFCIPTEEAKDSENDSHELATPQKSSPRAAIPSSRPAVAAKPTSDMAFPNYGRAKGQRVAGASKQDLTFYLEGARKSLADPSKARFHASEQKLIQAIEAELAQGQRQPDDGPPPHNDADQPF